MQTMFIDISKYIFAALMTIYTFVSYIGATQRREKALKKIYVLQNIFMFSIHLLAYLIMYIITDNLDYVLLYFAQFVFLFLTIMIYDILYPKASRLLVNNMCMLMAIGFIIIGRLDFDKSIKQFIIAIAGTIITFFVPWMLKKFKVFRNFGWIYCGLGLAALVVVLLGSRVYGANINISFGGITFQPSEFVKILYVLFVASMFNKSTSFKETVLVTVAAGAHIVILVLSNDLGTSLIFAVVYLLMLYIASRKILYLAGGTAVGAVGAFAAYKFVSHVHDRVTIWIDPWSVIDNKGYQICQSLFAIAAGSWFGSGIMQGTPEKVPLAEKDFIISAITEEFGIIFSVGVILICLNNLILMMNIASKCNTLFYRLVAVGLGVTYGIQVFLTVGGAIKLIPMTGVTLPFVSYGGSSVIGSLFMFALINGMYNMRQDDGERKVEDRYEEKKK